MEREKWAPLSHPSFSSSQEDDIDGEHIVAFAEEDDPGVFSHLFSSSGNDTDAKTTKSDMRSYSCSYCCCCRAIAQVVTQITNSKRRGF